MHLKNLTSILIPSLSFSSSSSALRLLKSGDVFKKSRSFSDLDILNYSKLCHDLNPLHFDRECAQSAGFDDRIVHGMLVASLFPRIISSHFPGAIYVSQSLQFKAPVYVSEEIQAEVKAINLREHKNRFIVKFLTKCFKNGEFLAIDGEAVTMLPTLFLNEGEKQSLLDSQLEQAQIVSDSDHFKGTLTQ